MADEAPSRCATPRFLFGGILERSSVLETDRILPRAKVNAWFSDIDDEGVNNLDFALGSLLLELPLMPP
jgi:hypothetical protein